MKIGLLADTHGYCHDKILDFLKPCHEIWHCGDIGTMDIIDLLKTIAPVRAVYGNIDYGDIVRKFSNIEFFEINGLKVLMTHICGYPGKYTSEIKKLLVSHQPNLLVCGHNHILRVEYDRKYSCMYMNPGAAGKTGFHRVMTALRFDIGNGRLENLELVEIERL